MVVTGALRFGAGAGTAKLFGILRDAYIARAFGLGEQVDAYLLAQTMALLPLSVIFLSLQPILTTAISRHARAGEISVPRDLAKTIGMGFIALALATLTIWFALPRFLGTLAGHPNFALIDGTRVAYGWIVAGAFCSAVSTLGYAVLHSRGKMLSSGLLPGLVPGVMVALLAVMLPGTSASNLGCALFLGYVAEMRVVILAVVRLGGVRVVPVETRGAGAKLSRQVYPMMLGMLMVSVCPLIEQSFAVSLGAGAVSALGFASRVPAALGGLASSALSAAFLPVVAGQLGAGHVAAARRTFRLTAATMFLLSTIVAFLLWTWSDSIVGLLFLGGKFRPEDSERVSILQSILGFGIQARWSRHRRSRSDRTFDSPDASAGAARHRRRDIWAQLRARAAFLGRRHRRGERRRRKPRRGYHSRWCRNLLPQVWSCTCKCCHSFVVLVAPSNSGRFQVG